MKAGLVGVEAGFTGVVTWSLLPWLHFVGSIHLGVGVRLNRLRCKVDPDGVVTT